MIRLPKLPDRNPIKLGIVVTPGLHDALTAYAALYREEYGVEEPIADLIPAILSNYMENDRFFQKRYRTLEATIAPKGQKARPAPSPQPERQIP